MKYLLNALLVLSFSLSAQAAVLTFPEWKQEREREAQVLLDKAKLNDKGGESRKKRGPNVSDDPALAEAGGRFRRVIDKNESLLMQAERNRQIAKDLTVNDYFILYLRFQAEPSFHEAIEKLSKTEMAELMTAYKNRMGSSENNATPNPFSMATELKAPQKPGETSL